MVTDQYIEPYFNLDNTHITMLNVFWLLQVACALPSPCPSRYPHLHIYVGVV